MVRSGQIRLASAFRSTLGSRARARASTAFSLSALWLAACPSQELAPITPCTIATAKIDAAQTGVDKVDVLFVIDNSGSMSQEQVKLSQQLPKLVRVLTSGDLDGNPNPNGLPDFTPVDSLHLGVVSSDLGVNGQLDIRSCGNQSFLATEQDTSHAKLLADKPHGDQGKLLHTPDVALAGVNIQVDQNPVLAIAPRPECAGVTVNRFIDVKRGSSNLDEVVRQFGCVAQLGVNGCGFEQQLESMWRALAPSTDTTFSRMTAGQGNPSGYNAGFLREDAVLVVILVTDEEDCSSPDASRAVVYDASSNDRNVLCMRNPNALHPVQRYIDGLLSLKPAAYRNRIIFAGIVGVPLAVNTKGMTLDQILALPEMQPAEDPGPPLAVRPSCVASNGAGRADPARRMVALARGFEENGVVTSICEDDYGPALDAVIKKIAEKLSGACLPRQLKVNEKGLVECTVVEIKAAKDQVPCEQTPGRVREIDRIMLDGSQRIVCEVNQLPVLGRQIPTGQGWYYDNFSEQLLKDCKTNRQRVAFAASSPLSSGALAKVVCQQSVLNVTSGAMGADAVNAPCTDDGRNGLVGDAKCQALSLPGQALVCVQGTCQLSCMTSADCQPGFVCDIDAQGRGFCANPTCPISESDPGGADATVPAGP